MTSISQYHFIRSLGEGSFAKVKRNSYKVAVHNLTNQEVAIKIIKHSGLKDSGKLAKIKQEAKILSSFNHPHILRVYDLIESEEGIFIVMEYLSGGELYDLILKKQRFSEDESRLYFQQLVHAVEYCHQHGVAHRDIKPENILLDDQSNIKLGDFGLANYFTDGVFMKSSCGSLNYAAPEIISGSIYSGPDVDVWSSGVVLFLLVTGYLPFDENNTYTLFAKIKNADYIFPPGISEQCKDLIGRMLCPDPVDRISLSQIHHHPWFQVNMPNHLNYVTDCLDRRNEIMGLNWCRAKFGEVVDEEIFMKCLQFNLVPENYTQEKIRRRIVKQKQDEFCVAYRIMHDKKEKEKRNELNLANLDIVLAFSRKPERNSSDNKYSMELRKSTSAIDDFDICCLLNPHNWNFGFRTDISLPECMKTLLNACLSLKLEMKKICDFRYKFKLKTSILECKIFRFEESDTSSIVIDLLRIGGSPMQFMQICADLYIKMHNSNRRVANREMPSKV